MTSPVSAIEAIEKAMEGVTHPDAPEWIAVAQDGDGPNGGFWTCAAATTESPRYIRADIYSALARQAEALQRENAELAKSFLEVLNAVRDYLPPDGISAGDCLSRVIGAVDNSGINPLIKKLEHADVDA